MVHSDVCGAMQTATPSGKRYMVTFIDDFSKYAVVYLIRNKSETFGKFREYVEMCKTMLDSKPKFLRSDRGGEYVDDEFVKYLENEGIQYNRTAPYTPQQNSVAERKNRTLIEMARCMILEAGIAKSFWGEAVIIANYIQNRLPAKDVEKTPYELWFGTKLSVAHFKRFGSNCYVHVPDDKRKKLDPKAIAAIMVGYDLQSKAYRCYVPASGKVIISRDVQFVNKDSDWNVHQSSTENVVVVGSRSDDRIVSEGATDDCMESINRQQPAETNEPIGVRRSQR